MLAIITAVTQIVRSTAFDPCRSFPSVTMNVRSCQKLPIGRVEATFGKAPVSRPFEVQSDATDSRHRIGSSVLVRQLSRPGLCTYVDPYRTRTIAKGFR
jgi:hypothetical protein